MMKLKSARLAAAVLLPLLACSALAEGIQKLGFIDTDRVYRQSTQAQQIQTTLQNEFGSRQQALQQQRDQGVALQARLNSGRLSPEEYRRVEQQLIELDRNLLRQASELAEEYNLRRNEEFAALQHNANRVIEELARRGGYDMILRDAVYVDRQYDMTDAVIRELNRQ